MSPRLFPFAAVAALHLAFLAGLMALAPSARERLVSSAPILVRFLNDAPRAAIEARPLPRPTKPSPAPVRVAMPEIAISVDAPAAQPQRAATTPGDVVQAEAPPAAQVSAPIEEPRFDMAYLRNPAPAYPAMSRRLHEQGRVLLRVRVNAAGDPEEVEVRASSGSERLDRAAIEAVRQWRFLPARRGAETVAAWALVPVLFKLDA